MKNSARHREKKPFIRANFRYLIFAAILLVAAVVTAIAKYESHPSQPSISQATAAPKPGYVTVNVNGKKIQVNAMALQQGPLNQQQSQQLADALKDNKSTDGLVQVQLANGAVEMDLQGRFQDVAVARKNDDGTISQACVDSPEAANAFLQSKEKTSLDVPVRKAAVKE
jgi:hypothetical protein